MTDRPPTHTFYLYCVRCGNEQRQPSTRCVRCDGIDFRTVPVSYDCGHDPQSATECCWKHCAVSSADKR